MEGFFKKFASVCIITVAALIGVLIFRETMSVQALCGAVLILGAVGLLNKQG